MKTIVDEIQRISPRELVLPESSSEAPIYDPIQNALDDYAVSYLDSRFFEQKSGRSRLLEQFKTRSLEGFGCAQLIAGICAAGALLAYVNETQKQPVTHLNRIQSYALSDYLVVDDLSCRNLELLKNIRSGTNRGTLFSIVDHTVTAMGGRMLKRWLRYPCIDADTINARFDALDEAHANMPLTRQIRETLKAVYDLERLGSKIAMGQCNARDLVALKRSLQTLPDIENLSGAI